MKGRTKVEPLILAGDLGGSKANLAMFRVVGGALQVEREGQMPSGQFPGPGELLREFTRDHAGAPDAVCVGIAGPVQGGQVKTPNLPWTVDAWELAAATGASRVHLVNDLVATGYGVLNLPPESFAMLGGGRSDPTGAVAVIAAGTGLGEAALVWDGQRHRAVPSEGGHGDFAPADEEQAELWRFLREEFGHVSVERALSGPGLHNIYRFLVTTRRCSAEPLVTERLGREDPGAVIGELGVAGADPACARAVELFCRVYGAAAGNLGLTMLATGGVYLAGGIAPKLLPVLRSGGFREAFADKGRLGPLLESVPVRVVLDPRAAVHGAGRYAAEEGGWL